MTNALVVSNVALWIVVVILAGVVLALVRQIGVLYERVAPAGALVVGSGPKAGEAAPVFDVTELSGKSRVIGGESDNGRSMLLFFISPTCPVCKTLLPALRSISSAERKWLGVVLASDGVRKEHEAFVAEYRLEQFPYVLSSELGIGYRVGRLPHAVLIDAEGVIRSTGLVNSREHLESLFEANERGVASLQEYMAKTAQNNEEVA
ncbi:MAG: methylamine dehydrogenase accessory protein MauD [Gammaproteobacteria bacterium]|jgi:methylamine dehydrogenase accessory protein MauD